MSQTKPDNPRKQNHLSNSNLTTDAIAAYLYSPNPNELLKIVANRNELIPTLGQIAAETEDDRLAELAIGNACARSAIAALLGLAKDGDFSAIASQREKLIENTSQPTPIGLAAAYIQRTLCQHESQSNPKLSLEKAIESDRQLRQEIQRIWCLPIGELALRKLIPHPLTETLIAILKSKSLILVD